MADGASTKWLTTPAVRVSLRHVVYDAPIYEPNSNARLPSSLRPVKMSSFDLVAPISRGSRCVPPALSQRRCSADRRLACVRSDARTQV